MNALKTVLLSVAEQQTIEEKESTSVSLVNVSLFSEPHVL
jgi:hypothetical protein